MGWYHHEIASGRDPFEDEKKASVVSSYQQQQQQQQEVKNVPACTDGSCTQVSNVITTTSTVSTTLSSDTASMKHMQQAVVEEELYLEDGPIYHLCDKATWMVAIRQQQSYYPPTFWLDGRFTRTCCKKDMMIQTGNEYYKNHKGEWILLVLNPNMIRNFGIPIACHFAPESTVNTPVECLKVYSGISVTTPGLVTDVYLMQRSADGTFMSMISDTNDTIPRCVTVTSPQHQLSKNKTTIEVKKEGPVQNGSEKVDNKEQENKAEKKCRGLLWMRKSSKA